MSTCSNGAGLLHVAESGPGHIGRRVMALTAAVIGDGAYGVDVLPYQVNIWYTCTWKQRGAGQHGPAMATLYIGMGRCNDDGA